MVTLGLNLLWNWNLLCLLVCLLCNCNCRARGVQEQGKILVWRVYGWSRGLVYPLERTTRMEWSNSNRTNVQGRLILTTYFHNVFWVGTRTLTLICLAIYICLGSWLCSPLPSYPWPQALSKVKARSVVQVFERITGSGSLAQKNQNQRTIGSNSFKNLKKELPFSWKNRQRIHGCVVDSLTFLKTVDMYENWFFEYLRTCK